VLCGAGATARVKSALLELLPESLKLILQLGSFFPQIADFVSPSPLDRSGDERLSPRALERLSNRSSVVFRCRRHEDSVTCRVRVPQMEKSASLGI
jgi:hypothetical protein